MTASRTQRNNDTRKEKQEFVRNTRICENIVLPASDWSFWYVYHCLKSVRIRSYFGPYFPAFGLNTERYGVYGEYRHFSRSTQTNKFYKIRCLKLQIFKWENRPKLCENCVFPQNFHTRKLVEITAFFAVLNKVIHQITRNRTFASCNKFYDNFFYFLP